VLRLVAAHVAEHPERMTKEARALAVFESNRSDLHIIPATSLEIIAGLAAWKGAT